jgi:phosphate-selective porin OprO and OprP
MKFVWSAVLALSVAGAAYADDDDEAKKPARTYTQAEYEALLDLANRVLKLEELQQDAELEKLKAAAAKEKQEEQKGLPERVSNLEKKMGAAGQTWDASKMLAFATPDGNFTAKVAGRFYFVYRNVLDGPNSGIGAPRDSFIIDTARIRVEGSFYKDFFYQVETEGKSGTPAGQNGAYTLNEAWLSWRGLGDWVAVTAGLTKIPISQEETTSSRFIDFAERSVLNRITPGRDIQFTLNGSLFDKVVEWWAGIANGNVNRETLKLGVDTNDEKDYFVRLFLTPLKTSNVALFKQLRVGVDASTGERDNPNGGAPANVSSGDLGLPAILTYTAGPNVIRGDQTRVNWNFSWLYGPASLRAEYARVRSDINGGPHKSFIQRAWYVQATYLLTGEDKALENRVKPRVNFDPLGGTWGAWELALRWAVIASNAPSQGLGRGQTHTTEYTVGVNWWMTPNVALRINWERFTYDDDIAAGRNGALQRYEDCFYVRWQIDF